MEEREARANRFVSHLVGDTESERHSQNSKVVPLLPRRVARVRAEVEAAFLPGALDSQHLLGLSAQQSARTSPTLRGLDKTPS